MRPVQAWKKLGIGKTTDRREIKRAYAGKLKAIDPDRDPEAFLSLREALEVALWQADADLWEENNPDGDNDYEEHEDWGEPEHAEPSTDPVFVRRDRLAEILWGDEPIGPLEEEALQLAAQVTADSDADMIDEAGRVEDWLLWLTANTIRRSDCIIPFLVGHYKWRNKQGSIHASYEHEEVIGRYNALVYLQALRRPEHVHHACFQQLTTPRTSPPNLLERIRRRADLRHFVGWIRENHPTIEWEFDAETMAMWEPSLQVASGGQIVSADSGGSIRLIWLVLIFAGVAARACNPDNTPPPPVPEVSFQETAPAVPVPPPSMATDVPDTQSRWIYSSPAWRSEQAPRVQRWMDEHPDELDRLLQPHIKSGGLPDCSKLVKIADMNATEANQCQSAQNRRTLTKAQSPSSAVQPVPAPAQSPVEVEAPKVEPVAGYVEGDALDKLCKDERYKDEGYCKQ